MWWVAHKDNITVQNLKEENILNTYYRDLGVQLN